MELTEAEDIKKRWQEYTEENEKEKIHRAKRGDPVRRWENTASCLQESYRRAFHSVIPLCYPMAMITVQSLSRVWFLLTWTVAHQAPLSMGFSRQEYWSGLPFPSPGDLPDSGIQPVSPALAAGFFTTEPPGKSPGSWCLSGHMVPCWLSWGVRHFSVQKWQWHWVVVSRYSFLFTWKDSQVLLKDHSLYCIQHSLSEYRLAKKVQKSFYCL